MTTEAPFYIEVTHSIERLSQLKEHWQTLLINSETSNPFYAHWSLQPAIEYLTSANISIILIWSDRQQQSLLGLFPIENRDQYKKLPINHIISYSHAFCYLATPLVDKRYTFKVINTFLHWSREQGVTLVTLDNIYCDHFHNELMHVLRTSSHSYNTVKVSKRALLKSDLSGNQYIETHVSKRRQSEFKRLYRRLSEQGKVDIKVADVNEKPDKWLALFLELEKSGWKGKQNSAIANNPQHLKYIEQIFYAAAKENRFFCTELNLDGKMIAGNIALLSDKKGYGFKTSYDETYKAYSPGTLLMLETTKILLDNKLVTDVDSCATENHPMLNRIWKQKIEITTVEIFLHKPYSKLLFKLLSSLKTIRNWLRR